MNFRSGISMSVYFAAISCQFALAHDPLTPAAIQQFTADGTYDERLSRIQYLQQFQLPEGMRQRAIYKVRRAALEATGMTEAAAARALTSGPLMAFPFTAQPELRSRGTVKTLTILIDFKDHRAATELPAMTPGVMAENIYGAGSAFAQLPAQMPIDSVHNYYQRASQGLVDLKGNVLGWHHFPDNRAIYQPARAPASLPPEQRQNLQAKFDNAANFRLLKDALQAMDATHDFAQYDNDSDGDIDLVTIMYAGPNAGWGSFWWAYRWEFFVPEALTTKFDGKRAKQFVFQFVSTRGPTGTDFDPTTLMHEMGHAFGLADYYDYRAGIGPDGGVGGLDMMDANQGNQNAFSRWLLDWIKPKVVGGGPQIMHQLMASGSTNNGTKAVAIFPGLSSTLAPEGEMFLVENRHRIGNDAQLPADGLLVWHVDASVNTDMTDFLNDNSFSDRKLIRLVRADKATDFADGEQAGAGTYFRNGSVFNSTSTPSSNGYNGVPTQISIDQVGAAGETLATRIGFLGSSPPLPALAGPANGEHAAPQYASPKEAAQSINRSAADAPIDLDAFESLDTQLAAMSAAELKSIWDGLDHKSLAENSGRASSLAAELVLTHWAAKDGSAAVSALLDAPEGRLSRATFPRLMQTWARQNGIAAARWYLADDRSALRSSPTLRAGSEFAHEAFEQLLLVDPAAAVSGLERLNDPREIWGAVEGLRHSANRLDNGPELLDDKLKSIQTNVEFVHEAKRYFETLDKVGGSIKDPHQRNEFRKMIRSQSHR